MKNTEQYYDEFSKVYDRRIGDPYHSFLDESEIELVFRYGKGKRVLECGCGTGLILEQVKKFALRASGIDLSSGMIENAKSRGLDVTKASVTDIPFPDASFDLSYSFKVLAHVPDIQKALSEMAKEVEAFKFKGGYMGTEILSPEQVSALAKLPPLAVLRAQLLGVLQAPASKLVRTVAEPARGLAAVLKAYSDNPVAA
jgi:ubiquinone/menaquinone biosynthesis C-methylase UbiE